MIMMEKNVWSYADNGGRKDSGNTGGFCFIMILRRRNTKQDNVKCKMQNRGNSILHFAFYILHYFLFLSRLLFLLSIISFCTSVLNSFSERNSMFTFSAEMALPNSVLYFLRVFSTFSSISISLFPFWRPSARTARNSFSY